MNNIEDLVGWANYWKSCYFRAVIVIILLSLGHIWRSF